MIELKQFWRRTGLLLLTLFSLCTLAGYSSFAFAQVPSSVDPCSTTPTPEYCQKASPDKDPVTETVQKVTNLIAFISGFLAVFWIIVMGIKFQTSYGDPEKTKSARKGIIYAAVGLAVIVSARILIYFVLKLIG